MKSLPPKHKRLKRQGRLQAAKNWLPKYAGKHIAKGYSKHFGVNILCAALELRMLGYEISEHYIDNLKADEVRRQKINARRKKTKALNLQDTIDEYSDDTYYFIVGYTSNGVPYGITRAEIEYESED